MQLDEHFLNLDFYVQPHIVLKLKAEIWGLFWGLFGRDGINSNGILGLYAQKLPPLS